MRATEASNFDEGAIVREPLAVEHAVDPPQQDLTVADVGAADMEPKAECR
jgi:hypothetical protein